MRPGWGSHYCRTSASSQCCMRGAGAHVIHDGLQQVLHDGAQASGARAALARRLRNGAPRRLGHMHARAAHPKHPLVLLGQRVLGLGQDLHQLRLRQRLHKIQQESCMHAASPSILRCKSHPKASLISFCICDWVPSGQHVINPWRGESELLGQLCGACWHSAPGGWR